MCGVVVGCVADVFCFYGSVLMVGSYNQAPCVCIHMGGNLYTPTLYICWSSTGGPAACQILPGSKVCILHSCGKNGPGTWPLHPDQPFLYSGGDSKGVLDWR